MLEAAKRCIVILCALAGVALGQEVRATITGLVTDPSGAPVVGATVVVTNVSQNVSLSVTTNESGNYVTPFLAPGEYRLTVEQGGFKRFVRENIVLQTQDKLRLDVRLEIGQLTESITVRESVSLLQTETATRSQVIANELISQLPTQGRNPFQLAWASAGVIKSGDWRYLRSFDIGGTSGVSINGGKNKENEVLLDGISNVRGDRTVIHVPTMESVQEFKVLTNTYDAQYGRTGGGIITIVTKSGGNEFRGVLFEHFQNDKLNANTSELNRAGQPRAPFHINQFGFQFQGPVYVPKVFDGRNRLFWMLSYEGMRQRTGDPGATTFPLMEWRSGDFTTLYNAQGQQVLIYDPLTTTRDGLRQPFSGNRLPASRINPIAVNVFKYYPPPNWQGEGPAHVNNYIFRSRWNCGFDQWIGRTDFVLNSKNSFYFRYGQNPFSEYRALVWPTPNVAEPTGNAPLMRNGRNWTFDWTSTVSPRFTFNLRAGLSRWEETTGNTYGAGFDPRNLGFDPALVSQFSRLQFPRFDLGTYQAAGADRLLNTSTNDTYSIQPNAGWVVARHYMKFGFEGRQYKDNAANPGMASGRYNFGKNWTQANALRADAVSGNEIATFLLGYVTSASVDRNIDPTYLHRYYAAFFNDDWKVTPRLTVNLGLRWDYEGPNYERYNRIVRGFDWNAPSPIAARVTGLTLKGAVLFAGVGGQPRYVFEPDRNNFQPRLGVAFRPRDKWVVRAGYGIYYLGQNENGSTQGFSRTTTATVSTDGGLTPAVTLTNPFANLPGGRLLDPIGSSLGAASFLGESVPGQYFNRPLPYSHQYSIDIQRELPGQVLIEAGYVGNAIRKLPVNVGLNAIPASELGRRTPAGVIDTAYYTDRVPNPMAGLIPNNPTLNASTVPRQNLLVPFPQYSSVSLNNVPIGKMRYHGFQSKFTKRFSRGFSLLGSYGIMKNLEQVSLLNAQDFVLSRPEDTRLEKRSAGQVDIPQKFTVLGLYELPFGRKKTFGANWSKAIDCFLGGWQLNWDITYQRGWVVSYPNAKQVRPGSAKLSNPTPGQWFNTALWDDPATGRRVSRQEPFTLRDFPTLFGDVRFPGYRNWDASVSKYFPLRERMKLQFRMEMINAFNHPWFCNIASVDVTDPRFGQLEVTQRNLPRNIKLVLMLQW